MKTALFYFTGTGNTLTVAKDLAAALSETALEPVRYGFDHNSVIDADRVGVIYPVYDWGLPLIVMDFVKKMKVRPGAYLFAVAIYGGMLASSLKVFETALKERGLKLSAGFAVRMPGNFMPLYNVVSAKKQQAMFEKEKARIREISGMVVAGAPHACDTNLGIVGRLLSTYAYKSMAPKINAADAAFSADERCDGCGICAKVCPVKNITVEKGRVAWHHRCELCLSCFHWCPKQAIQHGAKSRQRGRYHHPGITLDDILKAGR